MSTSLPTRNTVFISYSHKDAKHLEKLQELFAPLERSGRIELWADTKLHSGDQWKEEIASAIQRAKAAILLVSGAFLASKFITENELPPLLEKAHTEGATIYIVVLRKCLDHTMGLSHVQYVAKSPPLEQMRPYHQEEVWNSLAQQILEKLGNADSVSEGNADSISDSSPDPLAPPTGPIPLQTLLVDKTAVADAARGHYRTIADAVRSAEPGADILIRPGHYNESLIIDKPLKITGMGTRGDTVIWTTDADVVLFKSTMGVISNLALECKGTQWCGIQVVTGSLALSGCDIKSKGRAAVAIGGSATPFLIGNKIHHSTVGVLIYETAKGWLDDNEIFKNDQAGVEIKGESDPKLVGNNIHDNEQAGILVREDARGTVIDNEISGNRYSGAEIRTGGDPRLVGNHIHHGIAGGILVHDGGKGDFSFNDISQNAYAGIAVKSGGNPTVRYNRICENKSQGAHITEDGRGTFEGNDIAQNSASGVEINTGGDPTLRDNRIHHGEGGGVLVGNGGRGVLLNNHIEDNYHSGIAVTMNGDPTVRPNFIRRNEYGIYRAVGARGTYATDIVLQDNRKGATFDVLEEEATAPVESQASNH